MALHRNACALWAFVIAAVTWLPTTTGQDFGELDPFGLPGAPGGDPYSISAQFEMQEGTRKGRVSITVTLQPTYHIFSQTQDPAAYATPTSFQWLGPDSVKPVGKFKADRKAHIVEEKVVNETVIHEQFEGLVTWTSDFEIVGRAKPEDLKIDIEIGGQVCNDGGCINLNETVQARFAGTYQVGGFVGDQIKFQGRLAPATVKPGQSFQLQITAEALDDFHIYSYRERDDQEAYKATLISLNAPEFKASQPKASTEPHVEKTEIGDSSYHEGPVTWTIDLQVPTDLKAGVHDVSGWLAYQVCNADGCLPPTAIQFSAKVAVGVDGEESAALLISALPDSDEGSAYTRVAQAVSELDLKNVKSSSITEVQQKSIYYAMGIALLGGFILNFMPCVLPVIGLKVMSFVTQGGQSRGKVFLLNIWYSAGLLFVFMILATLSVVMNLGWGEQSQSSAFNIAIISVLFVMALSFLGVWEIPIPGFVGSSSANQVAEKEGALAAFVKGMITTVLAVPCSGPGIATALTWCAGKSPDKVYLIFACLGLGMASPYLILGMNPALARFLPKPGAWMETFKQLMGFVLLGTVVFIFSYLSQAYVVPTIGLIFGLWAAAWWIGRIQMNPSSHKLAGWVGAVAFASLAGYLSFSLLVESKEEWDAFSKSRLLTEAKANKTVIVDFTADW